MNTKIFKYLKPTSTTINVSSIENLIKQWQLSGFLKENIILNCYDQHDETHLKIALHEIFPDEAHLALIEIFKPILKKDAYFNQKTNKYELDQYWDQNDSLSRHHLKHIFEYYDNELTFEQNIINYAFENDWFSNHLEFNYYWSKFLNKYPMYDNTEFEDVLNEFFYNNTKIDYNISQLLKNSEPDDLTLYFGTNWDDDYLVEASWQEYEGERLATIDLEKFINDVKDTQLAWLIQTQGYKIIDVFDKEKWKDSKFLQSIHSELYDYVSDLKGLQLIAIPDSTNWEAIMNLKLQKSGIIKAGTKFGLFNRIHGSGSGICIAIEKDIILSNAENLYDVQTSYVNQPYFYSPDAVYGLCRTSNENLATLKEVSNDTK